MVLPKPTLTGGVPLPGIYVLNPSLCSSSFPPVIWRGEHGCYLALYDETPSSWTKTRHYVQVRSTRAIITFVRLKASYCAWGDAGKCRENTCFYQYAVEVVWQDGCFLLAHAIHKLHCQNGSKTYCHLTAARSQIYGWVQPNVTLYVAWWPHEVTDLKSEHCVCQLFATSTTEDRDAGHKLLFGLSIYLSTRKASCLVPQFTYLSEGTDI